VTNDILGTFDPTQLLNGLYDVRLTAEDANERVSSTSVVYRVAEDVKVGNFTITLQDLAIPMAGIPITINRTYDSRDKGRKSDGKPRYGHRLEPDEKRVAASHILFAADWGTLRLHYAPGWKDRGV